MIAPNDRGFTLGDGLFETVLAIDGKPDQWEAHVARLVAGCAILRLPAPTPAQLAAAAAEVLTGATGRCALRISWSAGVGGRGPDRPSPIVPSLSVTAAPAPPLGPARLITARSVRRNPFSPTSRLKTLSYLDNVLARDEARAAGGTEAVMLNTAGNLACAAVANLFWIREGRVFTPALECGVLAGITRARLMAAYEVEEVVAGREALDEAEAIFLTNSLTGVRAAESLDDRALAPNGLTAELSALLQSA
jgi:branched-subunit amino acid aminotransferase/4-amino-4-deoxychorismate lyase